MSDVQHTTRQVVEHKLLQALNDDDKVAILATKYDLSLLERALEFGMEHSPSRYEHDEFCRFLDDIRKLKAVLE